MNQKFKAELSRREQEDKQTLGYITFFKGVKDLLKVCCLELPDRGNERSVSRIPTGRYTCKLRYSEKYKWHFILEDVPGRSFILMHFGNYYRNTRGCLIVGNSFADIDGDGYRDVTSSKKTMKRILAIAPPEFELIIIDE